MGHRANLLLVEGDSYRLFYCHWCSNTLPCDLFWGPERAIKFVSKQRPVPESDWLDDIWAEGGALIDVNNHVLLFFGGDDILYDVPLRWLFLEIMQYVWVGWDIRWAHQGIADLAAYVGVPLEKVLSFQALVETVDGISPPNEKAIAMTIGSLISDDGNIQFFPLPHFVDYYLYAGPKLVGLLPQHPVVEKLYLDKRQDYFPRLLKLLMVELKNQNPDQLIRRLRDWLGEDGELRVNPYALRNDPQNIPGQTREQILVTALANWRANKHTN